MSISPPLLNDRVPDPWPDGITAEGARTRPAHAFGDA
jgi:hypothetical protein